MRTSSSVMFNAIICFSTSEPMAFFLPRTQCEAPVVVTTLANGVKAHDMNGDPVKRRQDMTMGNQ